MRAAEEDVPYECSPLLEENDKKYREADQGDNGDSYPDSLPGRVSGGSRNWNGGGGRRRGGR